jgi:ankyrin repeat protein
MRQHAAVVKLLLLEGVNPDYGDSYRETALSWAAGNRHQAVVKLLLAADGMAPHHHV